MLRPKKYADDKTSMTDTIKFVYKKIQEKGASFDFIILLQPTAPFRLCSHIDKAIEEFTTFENGKSMVSVYKVDDCHPSRMYRIEKPSKKVMNEPEGSLRQDPSTFTIEMVLSIFLQQTYSWRKEGFYVTTQYHSL